MINEMRASIHTTDIKNLSHIFITSCIRLKNWSREKILDVLRSGKKVKEKWAETYNDLLERSGSDHDASMALKRFVRDSYEYLDRLEPVRVAKLDGNYKNATTQVNLPADLAAKVIAWGKQNVSDDQLHDDGGNSSGREDDIHCTLLYGITDDALEPIVKAVQSTGVQPFNLRLGLVTAFMDPKEYDVLKIDAEAPEMVRLHYGIRNLIKSVNKFPTYAPHITVAYVKKDVVDSFLGSDAFRGQEFRVDSITFIAKDKTRTQVPLGGGLTSVSDIIRDTANRR